MDDRFIELLRFGALNGPHREEHNRHQAVYFHLVACLTIYGLRHELLSTISNEVVMVFLLTTQEFRLKVDHEGLRREHRIVKRRKNVVHWCLRRYYANTFVHTAALVMYGAIRRAQCVMIFFTLHGGVVSHREHALALIHLARNLACFPSAFRAVLPPLSHRFRLQCKRETCPFPTVYLQHPTYCDSCCRAFGSPSPSKLTLLHGVRQGFDVEVRIFVHFNRCALVVHLFLYITGDVRARHGLEGFLFLSMSGYTHTFRVLEDLIFLSISGNMRVPYDDLLLKDGFFFRRKAHGRELCNGRGCDERHSGRFVGR